MISSSVSSENSENEDIHISINLNQTMSNKNDSVQYTKNVLEKNNFQFIKPLDKGSFSSVYLAEDKSGKLLAIKVITKNDATKEIKIHENLKHQNVLQFIGYIRESSKYFLMLDYCENKSLRNLVEKKNGLSIHEVRYFTYHITKGCDYLHSSNIIHRDLKLDNILLDAMFRVKICDFGLSKKLSKFSSTCKTYLGTPVYMAPEILKRKRYNYKIDMWSIGCMIHELVYNFPPFTGDTDDERRNNILNADYKFLNSLNKNLQFILSKLLVRKPAYRFDTSELLSVPFFDYFIPNSLPTDGCIDCLIDAGENLIPKTRKWLRDLLGNNEISNDQIHVINEDLPNIHRHIFVCLKYLLNTVTNNWISGYFDLYEDLKRISLNQESQDENIGSKNRYFPMNASVSFISDDHYLLIIPYKGPQIYRLSPFRKTLTVIRGINSITTYNSDSLIKFIISEENQEITKFIIAECISITDRFFM